MKNQSFLLLLLFLFIFNNSFSQSKTYRSRGKNGNLNEITIINKENGVVRYKFSQSKLVNKIKQADNWYNLTNIKINNNGTFIIPKDSKYYWIPFDGEEAQQIIDGGKRTCECFGETNGVCSAVGIGCTNTQSCQEECHWAGVAGGVDAAEVIIT